jgi:histidinol phosphatase-like PHP family hydrolase
MPWYHLEGPDLERSLEKAMANPAYKHCIALETLHGRGTPQQNAFSEMLRERLGMHATGGSDSHQPDHVGRCVTRFERQIAALDDLISELRAGRFEPVYLRPRDVHIPSV